MVRRHRQLRAKMETFASPHSITSSAPPSSESGNNRSSALVALRSMVRCMSGRSRGFSPLRVRPNVNTGLPLRPSPRPAPHEAACIGQLATPDGSSRVLLRQRGDSAVTRRNKVSLAGDDERTCIALKRPANAASNSPSLPGLWQRERRDQAYAPPAHRGLQPGDADCRGPTPTPHATGPQGMICE